MKQSRWWQRALTGLVLFGLCGQAAATAFRLDALWPARITSIVLIAVGAIAVFLAIAENWGRKAAVTAAVALMIVGSSSEIAGVLTGFPFGTYTYTENWWPTVLLPGGHPYPLVLPFAWAMMAGSAWLIAADFVPRSTTPILAAILATAADFGMEPVMVKVHQYWIWPTGGPLLGVPVSNALGWLGTTALATLFIARSMKREESSRFAGSKAGAHVLGMFLLMQSLLPGWHPDLEVRTGQMIMLMMAVCLVAWARVTFAAPDSTAHAAPKSELA